MLGLLWAEHPHFVRSVAHKPSFQEAPANPEDSWNRRRRFVCRTWMVPSSEERQPSGDFERRRRRRSQSGPKEMGQSGRTDSRRSRKTLPGPEFWASRSSLPIRPTKARPGRPVPRSKRPRLSTRSVRVLSDTQQDPPGVGILGRGSYCSNQQGI